MEAQNLLNLTRAAFLWTRMCNIPFWVLVSLLPVILYKELHITPWMITAIIVIKPASALFASYWSNWVHGRQDRLISNLVYANILRFFPFLFVPWIDSAWVIIFIFGFYMMLSRGVIPAWMEIFKLNLEENSRSKLFAYGSTLDYLGTAILPLGIGLILDDFYLSWRLLFPFSATIGLISTLFLLRLPNPTRHGIEIPRFSFKEELLKPWQKAWQILKERPDFARFQWGFMLGGAGLMVMQPMIPLYFVDVLNLSYTKMLLAMTVCKALGFALASPLALRLFHRWNIYAFSGSVTILAALFPCLLIASQFNLSFIYLAYLLYGVMQAGSELSWHMSGPHFAKEQDSSPYSMTNVLTVGVRGCFAPPLGSLLFSLTNSTTVLLTGSLLCLLSAQQLITRKVPAPKPLQS